MLRPGPPKQMLLQPIARSTSRKTRRGRSLFIAPSSARVLWSYLTRALSSAPLDPPRRCSGSWRVWGCKGKNWGNRRGVAFPPLSEIEGKSFHEKNMDRWNGPREMIGWAKSVTTDKARKRRQGPSVEAVWPHRTVRSSRTRSGADGDVPRRVESVRRARMRR